MDGRVIRSRRLLLVVHAWLWVWCLQHVLREKASWDWKMMFLRALSRGQFYYHPRRWKLTFERDGDRIVEAVYLPRN